jgi:hypothetical protein
VQPNPPTARDQFQTIRFNYDPLRINGSLYYGFIFQVPTNHGDLVWAHLDLNENRYWWYIIPEHGTMQGFTDFFSRLQRFWPDNTHDQQAHRKVVFQWLQKENLVSGKEYMIWFTREAGDIEDVTVSLNFCASADDCFSTFFPSYFPKEIRPKP